MRTALITKALALATLLAAAIPQASAEILFYSENPTAQKWVGGSRSLKLNKDGALTLPFDVPGNSLISITFSAECQFDSTSSNGTLAIFIKVDEDSVPDPGIAQAFCAAQGSGLIRGKSMRSVTVARELSAGGHTLRIDASGGDIDDITWIDDLAIVISR